MSELKELEELTQVVALLKSTPFMKKFGEEGLWNVVLAAKSCKIDLYKALREMNVVRGKIEMSVHLMSSLIRSQGHSIQKSDESTSRCCILVGKRADNGDSWKASFSIENAVSAGLVNSSMTWKAYPERMLFARALSILSRELFSDVIGGMYVEGEISDSRLDKKKEITTSVKWVEEKGCEEYLDEVNGYYFSKFLKSFGYGEFLCKATRISMVEAQEISGKVKVGLSEILLQGQRLCENILTDPVYRSRERFFLFRQWEILITDPKKLLESGVRHELGYSEDPKKFLSLRESMEVWYFLDEHPDKKVSFREACEKKGWRTYHLPRPMTEKLAKQFDLTLEGIFASNDKLAVEAYRGGEDV